MRKIRFSGRFKRDYKKAVKQHKNIRILKEVIEALAAGATLPPKFRVHRLSGELKDYYELHLQPDWLLIFRLTSDELQLVRLGSHCELFE